MSSRAATWAASSLKSLACGESGAESTTGTPESPPWRTRASMGSSPASDEAFAEGVARVRAAIDLAETGAVEADVRLKGDVVTAGLVAEQPETARMLEEALPMLRDGLTAAGFEVDTLSVRLGKAKPDAGPPGHFVDRST